MQPASALSEEGLSNTLAQPPHQPPEPADDGKGRLHQQVTMRLMACIAPLIRELILLQQHQPPCETGTVYRENISRQFDDFESACYAQQITTSMMQQSKFALVATIDELVIRSGADFSTEWMTRPLQLEFFGNNRAGEEFFERLEQHRLAGESHNALVEVYYLCLQFGFEGGYALKGQEQRKALMVELRAQIEDRRGASTRRLAENAGPPTGRLTRVVEILPLWVIFSVALALVMFAFLGFEWALSHQAGNSVTKINATAIAQSSLPITVGESQAIEVEPDTSIMVNSENVGGN